jgi:hypothetical protein
MEVAMPIYRLGSNELIHAPGVVAWAINGYHFKRDRAVLRRVIVDGWPGVPDHAAHQLLSGAAPHRVDGNTVVFTVDDPAPATPVAECPSPADQGFAYCGDPEDFRVHVVDQTGAAHALDPRLDLRNHSPTGFAWGYSGSGPAQLALAILCHALGSDERALGLYQAFKDAMILPLDRQRPWRLTTHDVLEWISKHPSTSTTD